jgi:hypothetical protein
MWPLTIDFEQEFGWNFIIHPTKYQVLAKLPQARITNIQFVLPLTTYDMKSEPLSAI